MRVALLFVCLCVSLYLCTFTLTLTSASVSVQYSPLHSSSSVVYQQHEHADPFLNPAPADQPLPDLKHWIEHSPQQQQRHLMQVSDSSSSSSTADSSSSTADSSSSTAASSSSTADSSSSTAASSSSTADSSSSTADSSSSTADSSSSTVSSSSSSTADSSSSTASSSSTVDSSSTAGSSSSTADSSSSTADSSSSTAGSSSSVSSSSTAGSSSSTADSSSSTAGSSSSVSSSSTAGSSSSTADSSSSTADSSSSTAVSSSSTAGSSSSTAGSSSSTADSSSSTAGSSSSSTADSSSSSAASSSSSTAASSSSTADSSSSSAAFSSSTASSSSSSSAAGSSSTADSSSSSTSSSESSSSSADGTATGTATSSSSTAAAPDSSSSSTAVDSSSSSTAADGSSSSGSADSSSGSADSSSGADDSSSGSADSSSGSADSSSGADDSSSGSADSSSGSADSSSGADDGSSGTADSSSGPSDDPLPADDDGTGGPTLPALNCTAAATQCPQLHNCSACSDNPCCGWCANIVNGTGSVEFGTCYPYEYDEDLSQIPPSQCTGNNVTFQDECGVFIPKDSFKDDGSVDCSTAVCSATSCSQCQFQGACCGWCATTKTCFNYGGDEENIQLNGQCDDDDNVLLYSCEVCSQTNCSALASCSQCSDSACCGWCPTSQQCLPVNATNPGKPTPIGNFTCSMELDVTGECEPVDLPPASVATFSLPASSSNAAIPVAARRRLLQSGGGYQTKFGPFGHIVDPVPFDIAAIDPTVTPKVDCQVNGVTVGFSKGIAQPCFCYPGYIVDESRPNKDGCVADPSLAHFAPWMLQMIPACAGQETNGRRDICDAPEVVQAYATAMKRTDIPLETAVLDYALYILTNDDGSDPSITPQMASAQQSLLDKYFAPAKIQWRKNEVRVPSTLYKTKTLVPNECTPSVVGNGVCDQACNLAITGFDGGDCSKTDPQKGSDCPYRDEENSVCQEVCNVKEKNWDGGVCCPANDRVQSSKTCRDPTKPNTLRAWYRFNELLETIGVSNENQLNVLAVDAEGNWPQSKTLLAQTTPAQLFATATGGLRLYRYKYVGLSNQNEGLYGMIPIKGFATALGLRTVDAGVSENCNDLCQEKLDFSKAFDTSIKWRNAFFGDFTTQTIPMPFYLKCDNCESCDPKKGCPPGGFWQGTQAGNYYPFNNIMSWSDDSCKNNVDFVEQQLAKMRCIADSTYRGYWYQPQVAPTIVMAPVLLAAPTGPAPASSSDGVVGGTAAAGIRIEWLPALAPRNKFTFTYRIFRTPAFTSGAFVETTSNTLTDWDVRTDASITYEYIVGAIDNASKATSAQPSPPLRVKYDGSAAFIKTAASHASKLHTSTVNQVRFHSLAATCPSVSGTVCNGSPCVNGTCVCNANFAGTDCSISCGCQNGASCDAFGTCKCPSGFTGTKCQTRTCPTGLKNLLCSGNGNCTTVAGNPQCNCTRGFGGSACENTVQIGCSLSKSNVTGLMEQCGGSAQGRCLTFRNQFYCSCTLPYRGIACQNKCPQVNNVTCSGRGRCQEDGTCACYGAFKGIACNEQKPATYLATDCDVRSTELTDGTMTMKFPKGTCGTRQLFYFTDASKPTNYHLNFTVLSAAREIKPFGVPLGNLTRPARAQVVFKLGERSRTLFVNWSTVTIITSNDGVNWTAVNSTYDPVSTAVTTTVARTGMYAVVARPSAVPFPVAAATTTSSSSSSSTGGASSASSSSTGAALSSTSTPATSTSSSSTGGGGITPTPTSSSSSTGSSNNNGGGGSTTSSSTGVSLPNSANTQSIPSLIGLVCFMFAAFIMQNLA